MEPAQQCYLIAAMESNHNGDLSVAKRMVDELVTCGCDAITVSRRHIEACLTDELHQQPCYDFPELGATYGEVLAALELPFEHLDELRHYCQGRLDFIVAPYDVPSLQEAERLSPDAYQIDPPLLSHQPLLEALTKARRPVVAAVGMCADAEIDHLVETLASCEVTLLHCVTSPQMSLEDTALGIIPYLIQRYDLPVGYLDHGEGTDAALVAYALGAQMIEKPFTLDRHLRGPDHAVNAGREEWHALVRSIRALEQALQPVKERRLLDVEMEYFATNRTCLVAVRDLPAGTVLARDSMAVKAAAQGVSARLLGELVGKRVLYDLPAGSPITFGMVQ